MYSFTFHRPETLRQAVNMLSKNPDAKLLAGGHTLLPTMKLRLAGPPELVDLSRVQGLAGIELAGRSITIGAMIGCLVHGWSPILLCCAKPGRKTGARCCGLRANREWRATPDRVSPAFRACCCRWRR